MVRSFWRLNIWNYTPGGIVRKHGTRGIASMAARKSETSGSVKKKIGLSCTG